MLAWDAGTQRYQEVTALETGQGLWLEFGGDGPAEVTVAVSDEHVLLSLEAGRNLVGWTGADGTPIEDAVGRFADTLRYAYRWDARKQRFDRYVPGGAFNTITELNRGDALWLVLATGTRWWQSGSGKTELVFEDDLSPERRVEVREELASVIGFFAEHYGLEPPTLTLRVAEGSQADSLDLFLGVLPGKGTTLPITTGRARGTPLEGSLTQRYFGIVLREISSYTDTPWWTVQGAMAYGAMTHRVVAKGEYPDVFGRDWRAESASVVQELAEFETSQLSAHGLGALAVDWLASHTAGVTVDSADATPQAPLHPPGNDTIIEYFRLLPVTASWQEAFETTFGIGPEDFYRAFETYRDELVGPLVISIGDPPAAALARYETEMRSAYAFLLETLGVGPFVYFLHLADEESGRRAVRELFKIPAPESGPYPCSLGGHHRSLYVVNCEHELTYRAFYNSYFAIVHSRVAEDVRWLRSGIKKYVELRYAASAGLRPYETELARLRVHGQRNQAALSQLTDLETWLEFGNEKSWALALVAVDRLVEQSNDGALKEYFRLLPRGRPGHEDYEPGAGSWEAAFEQAFGLTVDAFYEEFAEYRAGLSQP